MSSRDEAVKVGAEAYRHIDGFRTQVSNDNLRRALDAMHEAGLIVWADEVRYEPALVLTNTGAFVPYHDAERRPERIYYRKRGAS